MYFRVMASGWVSRYIFLLLMLANKAMAQDIQGNIVDKENETPIAFAHIYDQQKRRAAFSDVNGQFTFNLPPNTTFLIVRAVGYSNDTLTVNAIDFGKKLSVGLKAKAVDLGELTIRLGENPALAIIRKTIANRALHHPKNNYPHQFTTYNKVRFNFIKDQETEPKDSGNASYTYLLNQGYFLLLENQSKTFYKKPGKKTEVVTASRISGFKEAHFTSLATEIQAFSFYDDRVRIADATYLNPITDGAINSYQYQLLDTVLQDKDSVFIVDFRPKKALNSNCMKGQLYISSNGYALQSVRARGAGESLYNIEIEQLYAFLPDVQKWFPQQLNFSLELLGEKSPSQRFKAEGQSLINEVLFVPTPDSVIFKGVETQFDKKSLTKENLYWEQNRPLPLQKNEQTSYMILDSLGDTLNFDRNFNWLESIAVFQHLKFNYVSVDLEHLLAFTNFEGLRYGIGLSSNDDVSQHFSVGGYVKSSTRDKSLQYGGQLKLFFHKKKYNRVEFNYQRGLFEPGRYYDDDFSTRRKDTRALIAPRMEQMERRRVALILHPRELFAMRLFFSRGRISNDYTQRTSDIIEPNTYTVQDVGLDVRYSRGAKRSFVGNKLLELSEPKTVYTLKYQQGFNGLGYAAPNFSRIELRIKKHFRYKKLGESQLELSLGTSNDQLSSALQFTGHGSRNSYYVLVPGYFQTQEPYAFNANHFAHLFFTHNFKRPLFYGQHFRPELMLVHNMGVSTLRPSILPNEGTGQAMDKGYYESGIVLNKLVQLNYADLAYVGLGAGVFYRYGPYSLPNLTDNLAFMVSFTFSSSK